ncbi:MAG: hypothetical protein HRT87_07390, partial [Legionellales bacterium]|nr:hypothetical protein [Legionellales bacterium]
VVDDSLAKYFIDVGAVKVKFRETKAYGKIINGKWELDFNEVNSPLPAVFDIADDELPENLRNKYSSCAFNGWVKYESFYDCHYVSIDKMVCRSKDNSNKTVEAKLIGHLRDVFNYDRAFTADENVLLSSYIRMYAVFGSSGIGKIPYVESKRIHLNGEVDSAELVEKIFNLGSVKIEETNGSIIKIYPRGIKIPALLKFSVPKNITYMNNAIDACFANAWVSRDWRDKACLTVNNIVCKSGKALINVNIKGKVLGGDGEDIYLKNFFYKKRHTNYRRYDERDYGYIDFYKPKYLVFNDMEKDNAD